MTNDIFFYSYYLWERDIQLIKDLGAQFYRYSISWARILPRGVYETEDDINWAGVHFYNETINNLTRAGIEPMVTLFHWDLPQALQNKGGSIVPELSDWFATYAELCFRLFGDRVKTWITFNEPKSVAICYELAECAPGILKIGVGYYLVLHYQLLGHQKAWHIYDQKYRSSQQGIVGITVNGGWAIPFSDSQADINAADREMEFKLGSLLSPLVGTGNYPQVMIDSIGNRSLQQGFNESRLPKFTAEEQKLLLGATDFVGINYYTASVCKAANFPTSRIPRMFNDQDVYKFQLPEWPKSASSWLKSVPYGLRNLLKWVKSKYNYGNKALYLTENGFSDWPRSCNDSLDVNKTQYIVAHLNELYKLIKHDKINVKRYTLWSLIDNFEWIDGFSKKFGMFCVDFDDSERTRVSRYSARVFSEVIANNGFDNSSLIKNLIDNNILTAVS